MTKHTRSLLGKCLWEGKEQGACGRWQLLPGPTLRGERTEGTLSGSVL